VFQPLVMTSHQHIWFEFEFISLVVFVCVFYLERVKIGIFLVHILGVSDNFHYFVF